jgi:hypothetical protein
MINTIEIIEDAAVRIESRIYQLYEGPDITIIAL